MMTTVTLLSGKAMAQAIEVPGDYNTINEAVEAAVDDDIIEIDATLGTYSASATITQQNLVIRGVGGKALIASVATLMAEERTRRL